MSGWPQLCCATRATRALSPGDQLPAPSAAFKDAWVKAASDAKKGEYSFRGNYNVWDQDEPSKDWDGLAGLGFT